MTRIALSAPQDYFTGLGQTRLPTPVNILLFTRSSRKELQQEALQNRSHHRFVLTFCVETKGYVHLNHRMFALEPGQVLLIMPFQFHHISQVESNDLHWLFCTFELGEEFFLESLRNQVINPGSNTLHLMNALLEKWLHCNTPSMDGELQNEQLQSALVSLLLGLKQDERTMEGSQIEESAPDSIVRDINHCLAELQGHRVVIADLAEKLGLSESWLRNRFKEAAGISLGSYVSNYRINRAMGLLRTKKLPIAEIAEEAGFSSPQSFSQVIKKATGQSPRAYRTRER